MAARRQAFWTVRGQRGQISEIDRNKAGSSKAADPKDRKTKIKYLRQMAME